MIADTLTGANNEELSVAEASLEYGVSEVVIRQAVRTRVLASVQHRWGLRLRREDMTRFVTERAGKLLPAAELYAPAQSPVPSAPPSRQASKPEREEMILRIVGARGEVSASDIHKLLLDAGEAIPYSTIAATIHQLVAESRLLVQKQRRPQTYRRPEPGEDTSEEGFAPQSPPLSHTQQRPSSPRLPIMKIAAVEDEIMQDTLAAMRNLGRAANLDEIYRALASPPAYVELVRAVRRLVKQRLVVRIKHEHRYLYRPSE